MNELRDLGEYKSKILSFLKRASRPQDIEKIRVACGIGNWNTALKHCLELHIEGKIQGKKSSKSWTFWIDEPEGDASD